MPFEDVVAATLLIRRGTYQILANRTSRAGRRRVTTASKVSQKSLSNVSRRPNYPMNHSGNFIVMLQTKAEDPAHSLSPALSQTPERTVGRRSKRRDNHIPAEVSELLVDALQSHRVCCVGGIEKEREEHGILLRAVSDDRMRAKKAWAAGKGMTHDAARKTMCRCLVLDRGMSTRCWP